MDWDGFHDVALIEGLKLQLLGQVFDLGGPRAPVPLCYKVIPRPSRSGSCQHLMVEMAFIEIHALWTTFVHVDDLGVVETQE